MVIRLFGPHPPPDRFDARVNASSQSDEQLIERMDAAHQRISASQRELFDLIAAVDEREAWHEDGAHDMAHWLVMRYGISSWKAYRWIAAAKALESLPLTSASFQRGDLGIDKVVELTRFATCETERGLIPWAKEVSSGAIRHRGDLAARRDVQDVIDPDNDRFLSWSYFDEGRRFGLQTELPAAHGPVLVNAIERMVQKIPVMPGEEFPSCVSARRADALLAICSARIAADPDQDRATVVVHARVDALRATGRLDRKQCGADGLPSGELGAAESLQFGVAAEIESGPVIHPATLERLLCNARVQTVLETETGEVIGLGRTSREPSTWMVRQIRYRDRECRFPGCGRRQFTEAHHIVWWRNGGRTDLDNLLLICSFHHKLVHEHGWSVKRRTNGTVAWFRPNGIRYRAGPPVKRPPNPTEARRLEMSASAMPLGTRGTPSLAG